MTLGDLRDLVEAFGGSLHFRVLRGDPPCLDFHPENRNPTAVADGLELRGVTWPKGRVVRWASSGGVLTGEYEGITVRAYFERPQAPVTMEEV